MDENMVEILESNQRKNPDYAYDVPDFDRLLTQYEVPRPNNKKFGNV